MNTAAKACILAFAALMLAAAACGTRRQSAERAAVTYPEPRFPSYLKPPASVDEVLPHVRPLARNKIGFQGNGLGIAQPGETVAFILPATAEDMIVQAVKRAVEERGVKVNLVPEYEVAGVSRDDAAAFEKARRTFTSEPFLRRNLHPMEDRFLGLFVIDNRWDVMSLLGTYPGDVWQLAEDQTMEPLVHVDRLTIKDPEGTDVWSDITEEQAQHWARGVYQRGHLYMFPNQATGRFGYSVVNYPAFQDEWLPREPMAILNGTIAGTTNHTGFYPRWEVHLQNGYVRDVKGGGIVGDALREFLQYPHINDLSYPFHAEHHTLIEKGRLKSLDNPEVRALASRYGNPDQILTEDWRPEIPGINAPGDYMTDYAPHPWKTVKGVIDRVLAGNYDHFYPLTSGHNPSRPKATEH